jgi:hypothetical protein
MKKHAPYIRIFAALAALAMGGLSTACSEINPASPSTLPGADIVAPADEVPDSHREDIPHEAAGTCSDLAFGPRAARSGAAGMCAPSSWRLPDGRVRIISDHTVAEDDFGAVFDLAAHNRARSIR